MEGQTIPTVQSGLLYSKDILFTFRGLTLEPIQSIDGNGEVYMPRKVEVPGKDGKMVKRIPDDLYGIYGRRKDVREAPYAYLNGSPNFQVCRNRLVQGVYKLTPFQDCDYNIPQLNTVKGGDKPKSRLQRFYFCTVGFGTENGAPRVVAIGIWHNTPDGKGEMKKEQVTEVRVAIPAEAIRPSKPGASFFDILKAFGAEAKNKYVRLTYVQQGGFFMPVLSLVSDEIEIAESFASLPERMESSGGVNGLSTMPPPPGVFDDAAEEPKEAAPGFMDSTIRSDEIDIIPF